MIDTEVLDYGLGEADDDDFDETVEVDDAQLPDHRYMDRELSWLAFNQRVLDLARDAVTAILLVTHNLGVVRETSDYVYVMHKGVVVEEAPTVELFASPKMDYTRSLIDAVPRLTGTRPALPVEAAP